MRTFLTFQTLTKIIKEFLFSGLLHVSFHKVSVVKKESSNFLCFHLLRAEMGRALPAISPALWEAMFKSVKHRRFSCGKCYVTVMYF